MKRCRKVTKKMENDKVKKHILFVKTVHKKNK